MGGRAAEGFLRADGPQSTAAYLPLRSLCAFMRASREVREKCRAGMARRWSALGGHWHGKIHGALGEACWTVDVHLTCSIDRRIRGCGTLTSALCGSTSRMACEVEGRVEGFLDIAEAHGPPLREEALRARLRVEPFWLCNLALRLGSSGSAPQLRGESLCFCSGEELPAASWGVDLAVVQARNALCTYISSVRSLMQDQRVQGKLSSEDRSFIAALVGTPDEDECSIVQWLRSTGRADSQQAYSSKRLECEGVLGPLLEKLGRLCDDWQDVVQEHFNEEQYEVTRVWVSGGGFVDQNGEDFEAEGGSWKLALAADKGC